MPDDGGTCHVDAEGDALFHQALAKAAQADEPSYASDDPEEFAAAVIKASYGPFLKALDPGNRGSFAARIMRFHEARLARAPLKISAS